MTGSISGLASGLDTAGIINQLMQLEAMSQSRLKTQQGTQKSVLSALQSLNTDLASLATRADVLARSTGWQTLKATSSSTDIAATTGAGAAPGTYAITVDSLASTHKLGFVDGAAPTDVVVSGSAVRITKPDGTSTDVPTAGGTLSDLVGAINGSTAQTGVTAAAVLGPDGSYHLLAQSTTTGKGSSFTLTNTDGTPLLGGANVSLGTDAQVSLGAGVVATSSTNTFTDLAPGLSLTLGPGAVLGRTTTITVAQDPAGVQANVKALVDQVNALLSKIDTQSTGKTSTSSAGVLSGDAAVRALRGALVDTVFGASGTTSMKSLGIQTDRYGKLVLDEATFASAYAADPSGVAAQFSSATPATQTTAAKPDGWAALLAKAARTASDSTAGTISAAIKGRQASIDRLGDSIEAWDLRLELRRTSLTRQFTALETALSSLQSQGNWLAGQLKSLPSSSS